MNTAISITAAIVTLSLVILVHELGHFFVAKLLRIGVDNLSVGFGPEIFGKSYRNTRYSLRWVLFGGYVKLRGEDDNSSGDPNSFCNRSPGDRAKVIVAGPLANLLGAYFLFFLAYIIGLPYVYLPAVVGEIIQNSPAEKAGLQTDDKIIKVKDTKISDYPQLLDCLKNHKGQVELIVERHGKQMKLLMNLPKLNMSQKELGLGVCIRVSKVYKDYPAEDGGILKGDRIVAINGEKILDTNQLAEIVKKNPNKQLSFTIARGKTYLEKKIIPKPAKTVALNARIKEVGMIGVEFETQKDIKRERIFSAFSMAFEKTFIFSLLYLVMVIRALAEGMVGLSDLAGPVGIMHISAKQVSLGLGHFLYFLGFLSTQLCLINILLLLPITDGGHLLLLGIEKLRGRPISTSTIKIINISGLIAIISLFLLVTYSDLLRLINDILHGYTQK